MVIFTITINRLTLDYQTYGFFLAGKTRAAIIVMKPVIILRPRTPSTVPTVDFCSCLSAACHCQAPKSPYDEQVRPCLIYVFLDSKIHGFPNYPALCYTSLKFTLQEVYLGLVKANEGGTLEGVV